ncbi:MAG: 30S ribosomal protein S6 [Candidatus Paceibacterota bacterium]
MAKNEELEIVADDAPENEADVRVYELGFHLDPELPTEGVKKAYQAVRSMIESKGTLVAEGEPQMLQLAYAISRQETAGRRDFSSAYFCWIAYETTAALHAEVLAAVNADKNMVRLIDLVTTKEMARHAVELHEFITKAPVPAVEEAEAVADVELDAALQNVAL